MTASDNPRTGDRIAKLLARAGKVASDLSDIIKQQPDY